MELERDAEAKTALRKGRERFYGGKTRGCAHVVLVPICDGRATLFVADRWETDAVRDRLAFWERTVVREGGGPPVCEDLAGTE